MASYTPDATNVNQPADTDDIKIGAAELRTLKAYVQGLVPGGNGINLLRKNLLLNGTGRVNQRSNPVTVGYGPDRWQLLFNSTGAASLQQFTGPGVSSYGNHSLIASCTAVGTPPSAGYYALVQRIEGFDTAQLLWGTAAAKPVTLSFFANISGASFANIGIALRNFNQSRSYVATVQVTPTGQRFSITIPGDQAGTWNNATDIGIELLFTFSAGTSLITSSVNSWQNSNAIAASAQGNLLFQTGAAVGISDIQLEQGMAASNFEVLPYAEELALCQRYYEIASGGIGVSSGAGGYVDVNFKVTKRATPSLEVVTFGTCGDIVNPASTITAIAIANANTASAVLTLSAGASTIGNALVVNTDTVIAFNSEL